MCDATIAEFIEAQRAVRARDGLPSSITDPTSLRLIAAVAASRRGGDHRATA